MVLLVVRSQLPPLLVDCYVRTGTLRPGRPSWELSWGPDAIQQRQRRRQQRVALDALISCLRAALLFRAAPSSLSAGQAQRTAARSARSVRDLHARTHVRTARAPLRQLRAAVVRAPARPYDVGPAPAADHSARRRPPCPLSGLAQVARSLGSLGQRWWACGGGARLRAGVLTWWRFSWGCNNLILLVVYSIVT